MDPHSFSKLDPDPQRLYVVLNSMKLDLHYVRRELRQTKNMHEFGHTQQYQNLAKSRGGAKSYLCEGKTL
jgi:hypothetical protein